MSGFNFYIQFQEAFSYTCDSNGTVICINGWSDEESLCSIPTCIFPDEKSNQNLTCFHGSCTAPGQCSCEIGWEGFKCDTCIPLPGCTHGTCQENAFECVCHDSTQYTGDHCDQPVCGQGCLHGSCQKPGECL